MFWRIGCSKLEASSIQSVAAGEVLIRVPRHCQLRYDTESDPALLRLFQAVPKGTDSGSSAWQFKQALVLLYHYSLGSRSPLFSYLRWLPGLAPGSLLPTLGMLMGDSAVQELQYGQALEDITNQKFWVHSFAGTTLQSLVGTADDPFGGMCIDNDLFAWAVAVTTSRCFGLHRFDPSRSTHTMTPLIDMADHSTQANSEIRGDSLSGDVTMSASTQITSGQPISLCYGQHDSSQLLLSYGFFTPDNERDVLAVDLDVEGLSGLILDLAAASSNVGPAASGLQPWQQGILSRLLHPEQQQQQQQPTQTLVSGSSGTATAGVPKHQGSGPATAAGAGTGGASQGSGSERSSRRESEPEAEAAAWGGVMRVSFGGTPPVSRSLLAAVRVMTLQDSRQHEALSHPLSRWGDWEDPPMPHTDELHALSTLAAFASALYQGLFPTTIQQDTALLATLLQQQQQRQQQQQQRRQQHSHTSSSSNPSSAAAAAAAPAAVPGTPAAAPSPISASSSSLTPAAETPAAAAAAAAAAASEAAAAPAAATGSGPSRAAGAAAAADAWTSHARPDLTLHDSDVMVAVRYRLEVKRALGRAVQRVLDRKAEVKLMSLV
ncbi:MAG: hypothetical protein WDW36_007447 [Sanguina aurantia]